MSLSCVCEVINIQFCTRKQATLVCWCWLQCQSNESSPSLMRENQTQFVEQLVKHLFWDGRTLFCHEVMNSAGIHWK